MHALIENDPGAHAEFAASSSSGPLVVTTVGPCPTCHTHHARSYHRTFPLTVGVGETAAESRGDLVRRLNMQRDALVDHWHRQVVERAIAERQAFLEAGALTRRATGKVDYRARTRQARS